MPFIPIDERQALLGDELSPTTPGQMCFLQYKLLIDAWRKEPRWTTIHNGLKRMMECTDEQAAKFLAFIVFFNLYGMDYEAKKRQENGDI